MRRASGRLGPSDRTRREGRAIKARWKIVNAAERKELRAASLEQKLQQLGALMASVEELGWGEALAKEEAAVRKRWSRLRRASRV